MEMAREYVCRSSRLTDVDHAMSISQYNRLRNEMICTHLRTAEHAVRSRIYATSIGRAFGLPGSTLTVLAIAAEIHDIGKLYVPQYLLDKTESLTEDEWLIIKQHPEWGAKIAATAFPMYSEIAESVLCHHERMDGSGYPNKLRGDQISPVARIVAFADAFAALTENRPFRPAYSEQDALAVMALDEKGKYDSHIINAMDSLINSKAA